MDAVVLHGFRRLLALHEVLEGLQVGDLGNEGDRVGSAWVPKGAHRDSQGTEYLLALRRAKPVLDIVHFVGDYVRGHREVLSFASPDPMTRPLLPRAAVSERAADCSRRWTRALYPSHRPRMHAGRLSARTPTQSHAGRQWTERRQRPA